MGTVKRSVRLLPAGDAYCQPFKTVTMKKLLVTTDFSHSARNALNYAADMAAVLGASIHILHVVEVDLAFSDLPLPLNPGDLMLRAEQELKQVEAALKIKTRGRIDIDTGVQEGSFLPVLKKVCDQLSPYAVVMGSQGKTAAERVLFGSHATHIVQELDWPVITVPQKAVFTGIKRIALAIDLTATIDAAPLEEIKTMVSDFDAELHIINIGKKEVFEAEIIFNSRVMGEMTKSLNPEFHFNTNDHTDEGIIDFVDQFDIDLLVVLPRRRNLFSSLKHRSHSRQLVLHSFAPVLALH